MTILCVSSGPDWWLFPSSDATEVDNDGDDDGGVAMNDSDALVPGPDLIIIEFAEW